MRVKAAATLGRLYQSARLYVNFFQPSFKLAGKQRDGALLRRRYHLPLTPCQRLLASPRVDESVKEQLRRQFVTLDPVALLKAIRDTQEELLTVGDGSDQPPARASEDLGRVSRWSGDGVAKDDRPRPEGGEHPPPNTGGGCGSIPSHIVGHWSKNGFGPNPDIPAKALMQRLSKQFPNVYPTGAQLRTLQRRVQLWPPRAGKTADLRIDRRSGVRCRSPSRESKCRGNDDSI